MFLYWSITSHSFAAEKAINNGAASFDSEKVETLDGTIAVSVPALLFDTWIDDMIDLNNAWCSNELARENADDDQLFLSKKNFAKRRKLRYFYHQKSLVESFISNFAINE